VFNLVQDGRERGRQLHRPREPFGFGGWNDICFGAGNITGWDGYRFWTRQRTITSKWALQRDQDWMS
jgi:malonate-semialdehyde dehydrogenase (acetylating)/methylmalonate-semialdehyde dehydrogenase